MGQVFFLIRAGRYRIYRIVRYAKCIEMHIYISIYVISRRTGRYKIYLIDIRYAECIGMSIPIGIVTMCCYVSICVDCVFMYFMHRYVTLCIDIRLGYVSIESICDVVYRYTAKYRYVSIYVWYMYR